MPRSYRQRSPVSIARRPGNVEPRARDEGETSPEPEVGSYVLVGTTYMQVQPDGRLRVPGLPDSAYGGPGHVMA